MSFGDGTQGIPRMVPERLPKSKATSILIRL
jgi:hypothetical protein